MMTDEEKRKKIRETLQEELFIDPSLLESIAELSGNALELVYNIVCGLFSCIGE